MFKKLSLLFLGLVCALSLCSCNKNNTFENDGTNKNYTKEFTRLCSHDGGLSEPDPDQIYYVVHNDIGFVYMYFTSYYRGALTVVVDKDGKPMTREEFEKIHVHEEK